MLRRRIWLVSLTACCLAAAGWLARAGPARSDQALAAHSQAPPPVPVSVARAARSDVPVTEIGLGTVQAWRTVTARAQVSGYISRIAFREGQTVAAGDLLATIDPRAYAATLAQAEARRASDEASLANDQLNYARDSRLARDQFASRQQSDNDLALVRQAEANVDGDDAAIDAARLNLEFCRITAPIGGVLGYRLVDVGNLIEPSAQTAIVTIQQIHPIAVVFTLPEADFERVQDARAAGPLPVTALTADGRTELGQGTLVTPNNTIDTTTGTISLKAVFPNLHDRLWPGQYVEARLQLGVDRGAVTVPEAAVQHGPDGLTVFVVAPDETVRPRPIAVGTQTDEIAVVTKGISAGEIVVTDGQSRLADGTRIDPSPRS